MDPDLAPQLAFALTGQQLALHPYAGVEDFLADLAAHGWDQAAVRAAADARRVVDEPWPHPVPVEWLRHHGAARWSALLAALVRRLGLDVTPGVRPSARPLTADERRLLSDVPPHHGA